MKKSKTKDTYYYDGSLLFAEKDNSGNLQKVYVNDGTGIVSMVKNVDIGLQTAHKQRLYYLYDSLGSVSVITGENGLPLQRYTYSPYGSCLNVHGDPINSLQFIGKYGGYSDNDSGLIYFWHRWYDAQQGRWISRDPIEEISNIKVNSCGRRKINLSNDNLFNLYEYIFNRSTRYIDTTGYSCGSDLHDCISGLGSEINKYSQSEQQLVKYYIICAIGCSLMGPLVGVCEGACLYGYELKSGIDITPLVSQTVGCIGTYVNCIKNRKCNE